MSKGRVNVARETFYLAISYIVVGSLYIIFSDQIAYLLFSNAESMLLAQTVKGALFVFITGLLLFAYMVRLKLYTQRTIDDLYASEERLVLAADAFEAGVWDMPLTGDEVSDGKADYIYFSPRMKAFIGFNDEELDNSAEAWMSRIPESDRRALRRGAEKHYRGETSRHIADYRIRHRDGSMHWIRTVGMIQRDSDGKPIRWTGLDRDITQIKAQEDEFSAAKEIIELSNIVIFRFNPDKLGVLDYVSGNISRWGIDPETIKRGEFNLYSFIVAEDRSSVEQQLNQALESGEENLRRHYRVQLPDHSICWISERLTIKYDEQGETASVQGMMEDVTELHKTREQLQSHQAEYFELFESIDDPVYLHDYDAASPGRVIEVNRAGSEHFGYTKEQIVGHPVHEFETDDAKPWTEVYHHLVHTGSLVFESSVYNSDGEKVPVLINTQRIHYQGKEMALSVLRDLREKKALQAQHQAITVQLEASLFNTVKALAAAIDKRDPYTANHQRNVSQLSVAIAQTMGVEGDRLRGIELGGLIHDIGKIYIPSDILNRPGKLSEQEFALVMTHPVVGYEILEGIPFPWPLANMVRHHHERMDGSGYPDGLKDQDICLEAKIICVADVVDSIATHRPYRPARDLDEAKQELMHLRGSKYDPEVVDACIRVIENGGLGWLQPNGRGATDIYPPTATG